MGWDRQPSERVATPSALSPAHWLAALVIAGLAGVCLFLLHASQRLPALGSLNIWLFSSAPLLLVMLAFALRGFRHGENLSHHAFLESEARAAQGSWEQWTGRYLTVHDSCVLLPDQVSAAVLAKSEHDLPLRTGEARRLAILPDDHFDRIQNSLLSLLQALQPSLEQAALESGFRVTLLCDVGPSRNVNLADIWKRVWINVMGTAPKPPLTRVESLSLSWIDDKIRTRDSTLELILVVQTEGAERYSDAVAALLVCLDCSSAAGQMPVKTRLLRPMPLDIGDLSAEMSALMQSQIAARSATGLLGDVAEWQKASAAIFAASRSLDASLQVAQQWNQESLCGIPGPFSSWLGLALGAELVQLRQQAVLVLGKEDDRHWISTLVTEQEAA